MTIYWILLIWPICLREPGVDDVTRLFNDPNVKVSISALSIPRYMAV